MFTFLWADYLVFAVILVSYAVLGLYFKCKYDNPFQQTRSVVSDYFLAGRTMGLLPVTASILVSFMSAISIMGTVSEVYVSGIEYVVIGFSYFIAFPLAAFVFLPTFYRMEVASVHQYLQLRFFPPVRFVVSLAFVVQMVLYMAVVLYAPAIAFSQVSGLPLWVSILSTGIVCVFYTSLGGMRAVLWTDTLQFFIMIIGMLTVISIGVIQNGGASKVWDLAVQGGRINMFNFNPNPFIRHSFWSLFFGGTGMCMSIYATNQAQVQRYLTCKTEKIAVRALLINVPVTFLFLWMLIGAGLVTYATFASCDPRLSNQITKDDQVFPYFVMKLMHAYSPVPGLFLSTIFAAALSTLSSGINSLANVVVEDIFSFRRNDESGSFRFKKMAVITKVIAFVMGTATVLLSFLCNVASPKVLQIALSLFGMIGGPILSVFLMGLTVPCVNSWGALFGFLGSLTVTLTIGVGSIIQGSSTSNNLVRNISHCDNATFAIKNATVITPSSGISIYQLSYLYYTLLAIIVCTVLSLSVSAFTGFNTKLKVDKRLFWHLIPKLSKHYSQIFPEQMYEVKEVFKETTTFLQTSSEIQLTNRQSV